MSNGSIPPASGRPNGAPGQSAPTPAAASNLTGYTPPEGTDEIVEELAEEIVDDVIEEAVVAPVQAPPPPAPAATPARVAAPAPVAHKPAASTADSLLDALAAQEKERAAQVAAAPAVPVTAAQNLEPRVTYTTTPAPTPPPAPAQPAADEEIIEDAIDLGAAPAAQQAAPPAEHHVDLAEFSTAVGTATPKPRPRTAMPKQAPPPSSLQATSIPVLITVGLLLLIPGVWALLIILGKTNIWRGDHEDARKMANLFVAGLPLGLLLISGAVYFLIQVRDEAKLRKERHEFALAKVAAAETARVEAEQAALLRQQQAAAQAQAPAQPAPPPPQ